MTAFALTAASALVAGRPALSQVTLQARSGEVLGVVGPNGAGKTTLLRAILGLQRLNGGQANLGGQNVRGLSDAARAALVAYLPQERAVGWNLAAWRLASLGAPNQPPREAEARARAGLDRVGLTHLAERGVLDMSGGERARVLLARLLAADAPLLLADEPVASLDPDAQLLVMDILREEAARGAAVVVTLHDLSLAARYCDRLAVLSKGRLVADGAPREALVPHILMSAFSLQGGFMETSGGNILISRRA
ncbi:ABC transporter ATP-binding protein [Phenylobacterium immobile]|uniref:ABC transporter ATP-binding protein n=1 Tax=Phenylobacterium immobile TaxID=21 RepID=UPI000A617EEF|nr:ABC transporter ATP-binding protein [Phenylobacterium immobile]